MTRWRRHSAKDQDNGYLVAFSWFSQSLGRPSPPAQVLVETNTSRSPSPSRSAIATPALLGEASLTWLSPNLPLPLFNQTRGPAFQLPVNASRSPSPSRSPNSTVRL